MSPVRIALLGVLAAGALRAQPVVFSSPTAGQSLEAGQVVEIRFAGVPHDAEELELLLVAGRDRQFVLRLTESLEPETRSFVWTVPNLALPEARLLLRMDLDGREVESAPSEPFAVESSRSRALAQLELRGGEVWIDADTAAVPSPEGLPGAALGGATAHFERPARDAAPALPPPVPVLSDPASSSDPMSGGAVSAARPFASSVLSRAPRCVPQRI